MGKAWDGSGVAVRAETWRAVARVLKPGAYLLAFGGTRTFHRVACAIEDAGFEIRDCLSWLYGQGFPKSLNLPGGLGTALKPSWEPIVLARKPFKGTVRANVEQHGTGALNIDACRLQSGESTARPSGVNQGIYGSDDRRGMIRGGDDGRWPANVCLDEFAAMALDEQSGELVDGVAVKSNTPVGKVTGHIFQLGNTGKDVTYGGSGGASRFYYVAKPSRAERDYGCERLPLVSPLEVTGRAEGSAGSKHARDGMTGRPRANLHPTVKPVELMRWLVRLVTPPGGTVLDPFCGSGTTGMACRYEQRLFIGIEREAEYHAIAEARIAAVAPLFGNGDAA